ncbi:SNF1-interacting protein [Puttea exsequens]|nr:SNF1-interacting protein [Puttea exsequens]
MADVASAVQAGKPITLMYNPNLPNRFQPLTLISPVGLKEAALDSPTFRSGFTHFSEQLELVEKWLELYIRSTNRLANEVGTFETLITGFLGQTIPPTHISEALLDHDYTLLAIKRYGEGAKEFWTATISGLKRLESNMVEPMKAFIHNDLRSFKEMRRSFESSQKQFDTLQSRYSAQTKAKEASSLREDAFQLHEARKAYLKASMDFSVAAPQLRMALDKMIVRVFADQWRDMRGPQQKISSSVEKWGSDIDRIRGWCREMEISERAFRRELQDARRQIEESAEVVVRPSRELDDYAIGSASRGPSTTNLQTPGNKGRPTHSEKQGWLNLRTVSGKPSRTVWLRRWFYVKNGIFGWLVQGLRSGGVEESDRIGVLLCNVKAGNADDRRCVFEVKTKDTKIVLQAENQTELSEWLAAFDVAKRKALQNPASTESQPQDPAFAISPPSAPEFAASAADSGMPQHGDENTSSLIVDRSSTLPVPGGDSSGNRNSFDVTTSRRSFVERDPDTSRDPTSRIIQKLDLHRKSGDRQASGSLASPGLSGGGIASLIAASHTSMPVGPGALPPPPPPETPPSKRPQISLPSMRDLPTTTLAPNTLANPPAPTNLSMIAVIVKGEKGIGVGRTDISGGMPSGIMANIWGSSNWGHLNRLARGEVKPPQNQSVKSTYPPSPMSRPSIIPSVSGSPPNSTTASGAGDLVLNSGESNKSSNRSPAPSPHRKTISLDAEDSKERSASPPEFPNYYPLQLKTQDAQFRLLFPNVRREERVVMVFKATWNPNDAQEFPGRVYVTAKEIYFYSNHCGMILITSIGLDSISEITAATGRDCDFIFCHLKEGEDNSGYTRITIKTFLEPLVLLQRRLNFLVKNRESEAAGLEELMKTLIKMEQEDSEHSPSTDDWEHVSVNTPTDATSAPGRNASMRDNRDLRANILIDRGLYGESLMQLDGAGDGKKEFKLPKFPVVYEPSGMDKLAVEKEFNISPKALFHVMFGDKSAVWQLLYHERRAQHIRQGPWSQPERGHLRRDFVYDIEYLDWLRRIRQVRIEDHQMIDVANEHLLYVVSDRKNPWHLPNRKDFILLTKIIITHLAKSKCKLAVYVKVDWTERAPYARGIIAQAALKDLQLDAMDLTDVIAEQVRNFATAHGRTKKAVHIFGQVGAQTQVTEFAGSNTSLKAALRRSMKPRTLTALTFESVASMSESVVTSAVQIILRIICWYWSVISANRVILAVLTISMLMNIIFSSSNTSEWWKDRKARQFMTGLGIGPDLTLSKSIYINELAEVTVLEIGSSKPGGNQCRDTFNEIMNLLETDTPPQVFQARLAASHRLQKNRQRLGSQRHDLLVAMRVVNSIEREMVQAEWETWLLEETARCKHMGVILGRNSTDVSVTKKPGRPKALEDPSRLDEMREWHQGYCKSCSQEQQAIGT